MRCYNVMVGTRVIIFPKYFSTRNLEQHGKISRNTEFRFRIRNYFKNVPSSESRFFRQFPGQNPELGIPLETIVGRDEVHWYVVGRREERMVEKD